MYSRRTATILLLIALFAGIYFLRRYLGIFALAALTTLLFSPLNNWLKRHRKLSRFSTGLTIVAVLLVLLLPLVILVGLSVYEGQQIVKDLKQSHIGSEQQVDHFSKTISDTSRKAGLHVSKESVRSKLQSLLKKVLPGILNFVYHTAGSAISAVSSTIVYFIVLATLLSRGDELLGVFKRLSPLDNTIDNEYLMRVKAMAISMVKGTLVIAAVVGLISTLTLWIIGFPYLAFWFLLFTFMSLIPLGAGVIFIPIGVILLITGSIWQGLLILVVQFIVLNNVDNYLRPKLAPKENKLPSVLLLVSTFAGVAAFGIFGVVYGPIIMVLIYTTIELYDRHRTTGLPLKSSITGT